LFELLLNPTHGQRDLHLLDAQPEGQVGRPASALLTTKQNGHSCSQEKPASCKLRTPSCAAG
jgi:hypothetical protein